MSAKVWIVDDDASIRWVLGRACEQAGFDVETFEDGNDIERRLTEATPDSIITDIRMPGKDGLALLELIRDRAPDLPVIIMTAHTDIDSALDSYHGGAFEYLPKPFDIDAAVTLIQRAVELRQKTVPAEPDAHALTPEIVGEAPAMQNVFRAIGRMTRSDVNVLISGESGSGKELVAEALHRHSPRSSQPFVAINTAAIPAELLESELFGHEKGAFTGAVSQRTGRFEQAHGGTLFLDEIGDMPAELQTRLLRVLSDRRFYRVGGQRQIEVDVRILAATNQPLNQRVTEGQFREDLYHRLNVINISIPPLRERRQDIPLLTAHFLTQIARELKVDRKQLSSEAMAIFSEYDWPGNVRQLQNACRWITVMTAGRVIEPDQLPADVSVEQIAAGNEWEQQLKKLVDQKLSDGASNLISDLGPVFERVLLTCAMRHTSGHKQAAAKRIGWGRNTLTRKLKELNIEAR